MSAVKASSDRLPTLADVLHVTNMRLALIAVLLVGASLFVLGLIALRFYMLDNLALSARSVAYAVEAPVVFGDRDAALEALEQMTQSRPVSVAYVTDHDGSEVARWQAPVPRGWGFLESLLARAFLSDPAVEAIRHNGRDVGMVKLFGSGRDLAMFLLIAGVCGALSLLLCGSVAVRLSRRASRDIAAPLQSLATVAAGARRERRFERRVAPAAIAELRDLGDDFNALLAELERWQEQMRGHHEVLAYRASHDPLTGLANRAGFEDRLGKVLAAANRDGGHAALFFIDADRFKSINDELGHEVGDVVLCAIARRLRARVRESDLVARLGGDEFAVLLSPLSDLSQAARIAGGMLESMVEPIELPSGRMLNVSLSIGIAFYPDHAVDAAGLLKKADEAMYESKRAGRGVYSVAPPPRGTIRGKESS